MPTPFIHPDLQSLAGDTPARPPLSRQTLGHYRIAFGPDPLGHFPAARPPVLHTMAGPGGPLAIYEFRPSGAPESRAALLWMHGGGYVAGHGKDLWFGSLFAERAGVRVFSVDYRLAPEHPFPAARDDCWAALNWLAAEAAGLGIDPARIAIGGASAGGGLAAALAIHNRDRQGPAVAFQLLLYPMLDHRHDNPAGHMKVPRWPRANSLSAWKMYLGGTEPGPTSVPAVAPDLAGLPPAFLTIGEADLFLDDVRTYAARLSAAGVAAELRSYPGVFHSGEAQGYATPVGQKMSGDYVAALARALRAAP